MVDFEMKAESALFSTCVCEWCANVRVYVMCIVRGMCMRGWVCVE
jgi:hypothetical protein